MQDDEDDAKQWVSKEAKESKLGYSNYFTDGFGATFAIRPQRGASNEDE
jgi:hypothetical protein